jgi:hypothetical protein
LRKVDAGSEGSLSLSRELKIHSDRMSTTARQLRLTVQYAIARQEDTRSGESADPALLSAPSHLLGGHARVN